MTSETDDQDEAKLRLEWINPAELAVSDDYQRRPLPAAAELMHKLVSGFDWTQFKPPVVTLIDGQITAHHCSATAIADDEGDAS